MIFISNLISGMDTDIIKFAENKNVGIEYVIFTDNRDYKNWLEKALSENSGVPLSFHGPYSSVDTLSKKGSKEYNFTLDSYKYSFELSQRFGAEHIVFHYASRPVPEGLLKQYQEISKENIRMLLTLAKPYGVKLLIENLAIPVHGQPLYSLEDYIDLFSEFPEAGCILDIGHLHIKGWSLEYILNKIPTEKIVAYHLHNNDGISDSHNRIMDGTYSISDFMHQFNAKTPNANLVLEYETRIADFSQVSIDIDKLRHLQI